MRGRFHIYTGDGKGKTTAAIGLAVRALGAGRPVAFVQFDKGGEGPEGIYGERKVLRELPGLDLFCFGKGRIGEAGGFRFGNTGGDLGEARRGLEKAVELLSEGRHGLVVFDELITAVHTGLLAASDVMGLVDLYDRERRCELVMTGRGMWPDLERRADLVTDMRKVRHYFDEKDPPQEGIEY